MPKDFKASAKYSAHSTSDWPFAGWARAIAESGPIAGPAKGFRVSAMDHYP